MVNSYPHIISFGRMLVIWFVLLAMSPCGVKAAWLMDHHTDYIRPLNKTKVVIENDTCQNLGLFSSYITKSVQKCSPDDAPLITHWAGETFFPSCIFNDSVDHNNRSSFTQQSISKYILFKRLKLGMS